MTHKYIGQSVFVNGKTGSNGSMPGNGLDITQHIVDTMTDKKEFSTMLLGFYPLVASNNITAGTGGAISVANYFTTINTDAGGDAFTLADGVQIGQLKLIRLVADGGGDAVITPTSLSGGTTITMNDAADEVELIWDGADWIVIKNLGATVA